MTKYIPSPGPLPLTSNTCLCPGSETVAHVVGTVAVCQCQKFKGVVLDVNVVIGKFETANVIDSVPPVVFYNLFTLPFHETRVLFHAFGILKYIPK